MNPKQDTSLQAPKKKGFKMPDIYIIRLYRGFDGKARLTMPRFFMPWSLGWVMGSEGLSRRA